MDHRQAIETIAQFTFPEHVPPRRVVIRCADHVERPRENSNDGTDDWLVDLANIERVGPNHVSCVMKFSSGGVPIQPEQTAQFSAHTERRFRIERLAISDAGTPGGTADWIVNDIVVGGRSQYVQTGDLPGDMFAVDAIDTFVDFGEAMPSMDVTITVMYIGLVEAGVPFHASMTGTGADLPQYVHIRHPPAGVGSLRTEIQPGFAYVRMDNWTNDVTIFIPSIDTGIVDVAIDAALTTGERTPLVDTVISEAMGGRGGLVHDAYVAFVMQQAEDLFAGESRLSDATGS